MFECFINSDLVMFLWFVLIGLLGFDVFSVEVMVEYEWVVGNFSVIVVWCGDYVVGVSVDLEYDCVSFGEI